MDRRLIEELLTAVATRDTRIAQLEGERAASVERRAAFLGVEKVRAERDEAISLLERARPYLVAMEDVMDDPRGEGSLPNAAMRLVNEIDRLIGGAS